MIQIVEGLPDNVVGIVATGRVTNDDCKKVLKPLMQSSLSRHDKLRLYYEIDCRFPGAAWEDLNIGIEHKPHWLILSVSLAAPSGGCDREPVRPCRARR